MADKFQARRFVVCRPWAVRDVIPCVDKDHCEAVLAMLGPGEDRDSNRTGTLYAILVHTRNHGRDWNEQTRCFGGSYEAYGRWNWTQWAMHQTAPLEVRDYLARERLGELNGR